MAALQFRRGMAGTLLISSLLGLLASAAGLYAAVCADLHVESSIVVASFLLLPLARLWCISPWLALALAGALGAGIPLLTPEATGVPGLQHAHGAAAEAYHFDVHLSARPAAPGKAELAWILDVHRADPSVPLPPALWLVVSAGSARQELALVEDTRSLGPAEAFRQGSVMIELPPDATQITGQLWTGPIDGMDSLPVEQADVLSAPRP
jgi:hypothetical protein